MERAPSPATRKHWCLPPLMWLALLCATLPACMPVATRQSNNLPPVQANERPPVDLAFIVHLPGMPGSQSGADDEAYNYFYTTNEEFRREQEAWSSMLTEVAGRDHFLITRTRATPALKPEFAEYCRTHPVVHVYHHPDYKRRGVASYLAYLGAFTLDSASLGLLTLPYNTGYSAEFRLTLPEQHPDTSAAPAARREYAYLRRESLAPLIVLPLGDEYSFCLEIPLCTSHPTPIRNIGYYELSDWRIVEKRQLLQQFLREIRPQLVQYGQQRAPAP